jgi:hypothetical protein
MERKDFDNKAEDEFVFFIIAIAASCFTGIGGILMYLYRVFRWFMLTERRRKVLFEVSFAFFLFPVYIVWKFCLIASRKIAEGRRRLAEAKARLRAKREQRAAEALRLQMEVEENERVAALPENRPLQERVDVLMAKCDEEVQLYKVIVRDPEEFAIVEAQIRDRYAFEAERIFRRR